MCVFPNFLYTISKGVIHLNQFFSISITESLESSWYEILDLLFKLTSLLCQILSIMNSSHPKASLTQQFFPFAHVFLYPHYLLEKSIRSWVTVLAVSTIRRGLSEDKVSTFFPLEFCVNRAVILTCPSGLGMNLDSPYH